jgi:hypothetical protein
VSAAIGAGALLALSLVGAAAADRSSHSRYVVNPPVVKLGPVSSMRAASEPMQCRGFNCYGPEDIREIYDIPSGPGAPDGKGQTIIVVGAFGSPFIEEDLAAFNKEFELPDPPSFTIIGPNGSGDWENDPVVQSWLFELTLDVEWAHAIAPGADIVLVVAKDDEARSITRAIARAVRKYPGAILSQSFASDETFVKRGFIDNKSLHRVYSGATALGLTLVAGSGDLGAGGYEGTGIVAAYPASDPLVTAVGGTQGDPWPNGLWNDNPGGYGAEAAWNETFPFQGATGGAPSQLFPAPSYQSGLTGYSKRTVPDVAYNASVAGGVLAVIAANQGGGTFISGGTSAGAPQWSGIFALANQLREQAGKGPLGQANPALYEIYQGSGYADSFHDITVGNNVFDPAVGGFEAGPGYDLTTGIGTPNVAKLLPQLVEAPGMPGGKPPSVSCRNEQLDGVYRDVEVRKGAWCELVNATVTGDVEARKATGIAVTSSTVEGDVEISDTSAAAVPAGVNTVCNSMIFGDLEIEDSGRKAPWSIGGAACAPAADVTGNTASVIGGDLEFSKNASTANEVSDNTVEGNLECRRNGGVTGDGNQVARHIRGQCSGTELLVDDADATEAQ